jgi:hypothetical protein
MPLININMEKGKCPAHCSVGNHVTRRHFVRNSSIAALGTLFMNEFKLFGSKSHVIINPIKACGPASVYQPNIKAAFIRRNEEYGVRWPGAVFDGEAALKMYTDQLNETSKKLKIRFDLRSIPLYTLEEADNWITEAKGTKADGLMLVLLDRQAPAWPAAKKAAESGIPTVIFSPLGTSFTINTVELAEKPGCIIYATNEFSQPAYGMKMLEAGARIKKARCVVIKGEKRFEQTLADTGINLQFLPAQTFMEQYQSMPVTKEIEAMADEYISKANKIIYATRQDVINGIKSYRVAGKILENEKADAISMDCLNALGKTNISLPCIAWSRMNDDGIPAACEADLGAVATHIMVQYLFDRPGFQQDPVADTSDDTIIGAHCSSPTRLNGFANPPEPFDLVHHHGNRDAVPRTLWRKGQRITCLDVLPADNGDAVPTKFLISSGTVVDNMSVPPSGGCVVSIKAKMDGTQKVLTFPGFHQLFFYGDYKKELTEFCQLFNYQAEVV